MNKNKNLQKIATYNNILMKTSMALVGALFATLVFLIYFIMYFNKTYLIILIICLIIDILILLYLKKVISILKNLNQNT